MTVEVRGTAPPGSVPARTLVLWLPDWPVFAYLREGGEPASSGARVDADARADGIEPGGEPVPIAVMHANTVVACSAAARAEGVRRGMRRRDAQARCPGLRVVPADEARDARAFEPFIGVVEQHAPGVQVVRPGLLALRARGPARYYGGEQSAAELLCEKLLAAGADEVRAGIADGLFTAERAARLALPGGVHTVPTGAGGAFLAPLTVATLDDDELVGLLGRLGVRTLGEFAALDEERVRGRFGERGIRLHSLAAGRDPRAVTARIPPPELARRVAFEPPLELADQVAFGVRQTCDDVAAALGARGLVCTELRIELTDDRGAHTERVWLHPSFFSAAEMVDRVRWQLEAALTAGGLDSGITAVRLTPEAVDAATHHAPGLFGQGPGARLHHALSRVQAMLGHRGVLTPVIGGGRWPAEREVLVPWGDRPIRATAGRPWPGSLPDPLPTTIYRDPVVVAVTDAAGAPVTVGDRGRISAAPARVVGGGIRADVTAWAGPWPVKEREWDAARRRDAHRLQLVDTAQAAWLMVWERGEWRIEGRYD